MVRVIALAAVLLTGCTVGNSPRMKFAGSSTSSKSVDELAGCFASKMSGHRGYNLEVTPLPKGKRLVTTLSVSGMRFVQQMVDIEDQGPSRLVRDQRLLADVPADNPVQEDLVGCL